MSSIDVRRYDDPMQQQPQQKTQQQKTPVQEPPPQERSHLQGKLRWLRGLTRVSKYSLGVLLILCVTVIWVASSVWIQYIFDELDYNKPFFLSYFNTAGFCFWNLGYLFVPRWRVPWNDSTAPQPIIVEDDALLTGDEDTHEVVCVDDGGGKRLPTPSLACTAEVDGLAYTTSAGKCADDDDDSSSNNKKAAATATTADDVVTDHDVVGGGGYPHTSGIVAMVGAPRPLCLPKRSKLLRLYSMKRIWHCATLFGAFWFLANTLFNYSLNLTSVASNTTLSSTSSVWTLLLSLFLPDTKVGPLKWLAVAVTVSGSIMMAFSDASNRGGDTVPGDILAIVSAFFYAVYTTILRLCLPDDNRYAMGMVFGAVGVLNLIFLWPGMLIMHAFGIEPFALPTLQQFWPLVVNALIGTNLSDVLWARSVILTSPVVATIGLSLSTPLAMVVDAVMHHQTYAPLYIVGAICITVGFIVANLPYFE